MCQLKRSLTCSDGLRLINELIEGTQIQKDLIEWKKQKKTYCKSEEDLGKVGPKYWKLFLKRNKHLLRSKSGKRYSVNRSSWTSYLHFRDMYLHIMDILVNESKIATKFHDPLWMDAEGNIVATEEESFGCKVPIHIHRPDMGLMFDEVGCNLNQEGDNSNGGEKYVCGVDDQPYQSSSTKCSHFTCLGVTSFDGKPVMCVVIMTGKRRDVSVETGIDWDLLDSVDDTEIDNTEDYAFFEKHFGSSKLFPSGPSCHFKGKDVPAFITFSESGGMDGWILREIFRRLDALKLYDEDRKKGLIPFALLDCHQSRFDLDFLLYINDTATKWNVCLGVPYGTALWQVGDASEQNGSFKMSLSVEKKKLFENRLECYQQDLHLIKTDVLPLVSKSWPIGFANITNNLKAIAHRGWGPFNFNLLLHPTIRATMTEEMILWERESGLFPKNVLAEAMDFCYVEEEFGKVSLKSIKNVSRNDKGLNFNGGALAQHVANTVISEVDRQKARERNQKRKLEGTSKRERIMKIRKKLTAGKLVLEGRSHHLDQTVLEHVQRKRKEAEEELYKKGRKDDLDYMKLCYYADKIIAKYGDADVKLWKNKNDIVTYLKPLKRSGDSAMPLSRAGVEERFNAWKDRKRKLIKNEGDLKDLFDLWQSGLEDDA